MLNRSSKNNLADVLGALSWVRMVGPYP